VIRLGEVTSTQAVAFDLAAGGAPDGTVIVAEHQTGGRGRRGRSWHDEPGASLLLSIVLRPRLAPARLPTLSLAAGVAVAEALHDVAALNSRVKWPNDVLVDGRKIAGILLESRTEAAPIVVVGIGINVNQRSFPAAVAHGATSIALARGRPVDREAVLTAVVERFAGWRARLEADGFGPIRARWLALADTIGRAIAVDGVHGVAVDLDEDGALIVADGLRRVRVVAGEVGGPGHEGDD
jgi:BirA family biotin operon repressor/biotin-[acetyl-CoA-carboxylase] ligase